MCGDAWNAPLPRDHEVGGQFVARPARALRTYVKGQRIITRAQLTTNHRGHFHYKICEAPGPDREVTQSCLERNLLPIADGTPRSGPTLYTYTLSTSEPGNFDVPVQLPANLTCEHCVLQWTYVTANNWGKCKDGHTSRVGCGPQETYRGCADVRIVDSWQPTTTTTSQPIIDRLITSRTTQRSSFSTTARPSARTTTRSWRVSTTMRRSVTTSTTRKPVIGNRQRPKKCKNKMKRLQTSYHFNIIHT